MRAVFQLPASMTSVVDAPRAVSSDASPTRPLCAVKRASMPAARAAAVKRFTGEAARPAVDRHGATSSLETASELDSWISRVLLPLLTQ